MNNCSLNNDLKASIKTERTLLALLGLYPQRQKNCFQIAVMTFCLLVCCTQQISMIAHIIVVGGDVAKLSDILFYFSTHTSFLIKLVIFLSNKTKYLQLEHHLLQTITLSDYGVKEAKIIKSRVGDAAGASNTFRFLSLLTVSVVPFIPYLDQSKKGKLPLPGHYPFAITQYNYYPMMLFQQISICLCAYININIDSLTWKLSTDVAALFDILKEKLYRYDYGKAASGGNLISYIELHYNTLILKTEIQSVFSKGIFTQFFASVLVLCFTYFQLIVVVTFPSIQFMFLFGYLFCMMIEIVFYCWFGNEVMVSSDEIGKFFFMSRWHGADKETRKMMSIVLERVKRPVIIMAEGLFPLSLATLISILRSSGSYLVVLKQLYDQ